MSIITEAPKSLMCLSAPGELHLLEHHVEIANDLARLEDTPLNISRMYCALTLDKFPSFRTNKPHIRRRSIMTVEALVWEARNGVLIAHPDDDFVFDFVCVNCHNYECSRQQVIMEMRKSSFISEWGKLGIKSFDLD